MIDGKRQIYEDYWRYTAARTDFNDMEFIEVLKCCVAFFDQGGTDYNLLQDRVASLMGIAPESVRKIINQLVKLGFLKPGMKGYNAETADYCNATSDAMRKRILSRIVYQYSDFDNSMTRPSPNRQGQINFFLKTLDEVRSVSDRQLAAMMSVDVKDYPKGYLTASELEEIYRKAEENGFVARKYNQISHLKNLLGRLEDLEIRNDRIYYHSDAARLFRQEDRRPGRDPYLQRVYKSALEDESMAYFGSLVPRCMVTGIAFPVLIASHIKPYQHSDAKEQFDPDNGLLLNRNIDSLFDLGYVTFSPDGYIIPSRYLDGGVLSYIGGARIYDGFINDRRMYYMGYHRANVFEKNFSIPYIMKYNQLK